MNHCGKGKLSKLVMILCCVLPILIIMGLYLARAQDTSWGNLLRYGALMICPLGHLLMMLFMMRKKEQSDNDKPSCH